jgi:PTH2 family peptidyl-tRNA hydrolase
VCRAKALIEEDERRLAQEEEAAPAKQVVVIRKDLKMRRGKEIAQGAHASMAWLSNRLRDYLTPVTGELPTTPRDFPAFGKFERAWLLGRFTKVVCQVDGEAALNAVYEAAKAASLEAHLIVDSGATEFGGVPTPTACGIGPGQVAAVDAITRDLKLY